MAKANYRDPNFQLREATEIYDQMQRYATLGGVNSDIFDNPDFRTLSIQHIQMNLQTTYMMGMNLGHDSGLELASLTADAFSRIGKGSR